MNRNETKEKSHPENGLMHLDDVEIIDFEKIMKKFWERIKI